MEQRSFTDKSSQPDEQLLKNALGKAYKFYTELSTLTASFKKDWNYSKTSGWMQKVHDGKKALYYFIPLKGAFLVSLAVREQEKDDFLTMKSLAPLHDELKAAKKYSEGYALKFKVADAASFSNCLLLIKSLVGKRK
jgi:hypothetical protein